MNEQQKGYIHLYYGDGKGKTTAAMGLALRAAGSGMRVAVAQFLKDGASCECTAIEKIPGIMLLSGKAAPCFAFAMTDEQKQATTVLHNSHLVRLKELASEGAVDLLILDEVVDAFCLGLLDKEALLALLDNSPSNLELVLTGHSAPEELANRADYVTEMRMHRHPYQSGVKARRGIEY